MDRKELIRRGNVIITEYREAAEAGCYLGNGRFGAVFGSLGLNMSPVMQEKYAEKGQSQFMHMDHWGRFRFHSDAMDKETSADYILPLIKLHWEQEPGQVCRYRQCQDFYDGTLETDFGLESGERVRICNWFDMVNKNLAGIYINITGSETKSMIGDTAENKIGEEAKNPVGEEAENTVGNAAEKIGGDAVENKPGNRTENGRLRIKATAIQDFIPYPFLYKESTHQNIEVKVEMNQNGSRGCISITCENTENDSKAVLFFYSSASAEACADGLLFSLSEGENRLFLSYGEPVNEQEADLSLDRTMEEWHRIWEESGWFDFPEETAQKLWIRSLAYLISSYADAAGAIQPTNGLTGNMFPFHFVQDMEYMAPALMMTGQGDIVKNWVEKFAKEIPAMQRYAKTLWPGAEGIYPPWELPYGPIEGYHSTSVPVIYCYEPHNAGYLCRLAKEAADVAGNPEWTERYVHPLVHEICEFYRAFCHKGEDGLWHFKWDPCIGQDEAGGRNKQDYLCSLYSAQYSFQTAVACGLDRDGSYGQILKDGLAFQSLYSERGTLHTAQDADDFGRQKHPVQLDGLAYFPVEKEPLPYERKAYALRHDITERAREPFYFGWTLGQFLLAGSNLKDAEGWRQDWAEIATSHYTDENWIQIYETSGEAEKSFYMTTHGMILQSLIRNYANDYWGELEIASCPVFDGEVSFGNIVTRLGVNVSGTVREEGIRMELVARRDCEFRLSGNVIQMKRGDKKYLYYEKREIKKWK